MKRSILLLFTLLFSFVGKSQDLGLNSFQAPMNIPMYLAGNFGEIRGGHFHAGIDIKTQQKEGVEIVAAESGFISRINVSLYGYGKAIYITHPNGYTTVYAHLRTFGDQIETYIQNAQYSKKAFTTSVYPKPSELQVNKGDVIALSGNTGGSGGPHLHFEIRRTKDSTPVNPLLFNLDISDTRKPEIKRVALYPMNDTTLINGKADTLLVNAQYKNGKYILPQKLQARGVVSFGIEAIDKLNGSNNRCGAYSIELFVDEQSHYKHEMQAIPFDETRFINAHVDFYQWKKNRKRIQKSFLDPHNNLSIYQNIQLNGKVFFCDYGHELRYEVKDAYGNTSTIAFDIAVDTASPSTEKPECIHQWKYDQENVISDSGITVFIPKNSFYKNECIQFERDKRSITNAATPIYHIGSLYTGLHNYMSVTLDVQHLEPELQSKVYGASLNEKLKVIAPEGGKTQNGQVTFKTRSMGPYVGLLDTVLPSIQQINFQGSTTSLKQDSLIFKLKDEHSGIGTYEAYLNETWALLDFDKKTGLAVLIPNEKRMNLNATELTIIVRDAVGNERRKSFNLKP